MIDIEVAYALANEQTILKLTVLEDTTVKQAIIKSNITKKYPQINLANDKVGIFGKITTLDTILRAKDRVEIYRPLIADPKEVRKKRAEENKSMRKNTKK